MESIHNKLNRVRKPRVHITYDVETEGTLVKKELPFVVGVMGDFAGQNTEALKPLKERRFVQIDRDSFDDVIKRMNPKLSFIVNNKLGDEDAEFNVDLGFTSMKDFEPENVVNQIKPLAKLMETRNQLRDLMTKIDRSEDLEDILERILNDSSELQQLAKELSVEGE